MVTLKAAKTTTTTTATLASHLFVGAQAPFTMVPRGTMVKEEDVLLLLFVVVVGLQLHVMSCLLLLRELQLQQ